ncbi:MAG TPA: YggS family pyridoxal phosphate-dependent enzyme [Gemmatimonadaceae bacterium]|nr:YggS family pyridoxal phosphate-dependent enzyme [Gemmatimonadaceae bacterium]
MAFSDIDDRVAEVRGRIAEAVARGGHGQDVRLIAVTKTHGSDAVEAAWAAGVRDVGENKVQEALDKQPLVSGAAAAMRWHLIGHLQRNKVRHLGSFALLHALDSARLADAVHAFGERRGAPVEALMQINVVGEETKGGYDPSGMEKEAGRLGSMKGLRVCGVMTMGPVGADDRLTRRVFITAREARDVLVQCGHAARELSMGMSADYVMAVEEGATMVRLGTVLFGART